MDVCCVTDVKTMEKFPEGDRELCRRSTAADIVIFCLGLSCLYPMYNGGGKYY